MPMGSFARAGALAVTVTTVLMELTMPMAIGNPITSITIDGTFADWANVPSHTDSALGELHAGTNMPDVHDTDGFDPAIANDIPSAVNHPDVDLREFKFTHDENNLYAYFRSAGVIGRTAQRPPGATTGSQGRYYVIVTIDVDNDNDTGYWLHDGGYGPTSNGYDMNFELEFFDGQWNTGHYLSHDATTQAGEDQDYYRLTSNQWNGNHQSGPYTPGFVQPAAGTYSHYTQWVYHENDILTLVLDRGPIVSGIMTMALSPDGHEVEIRAPFKGFLNNKGGEPNMALGKMIDISFSLEASGELAPGGTWASDTGNPINGYYLSRGGLAGDFNDDEVVDAADYIVWRKDGNSETPAFWQTHFGETLPSGGNASSPAAPDGVPEPNLLVLLCTAAVLHAGGRSGRTAATMSCLAPVK
jgi:hypothetical protein